MITSHTQNEIDTLENQVIYHYYPCQWKSWATPEYTHVELLSLQDYEDGSVVDWMWQPKPTMDQCWEMARYGIFDPLKWSLWTCEEFSDAELEALIDNLWTVDWIEYSINSNDNSLWSYRFAQDPVYC